MTPEQYVQKLIHISKKKQESLLQILNLTKSQTAVIAEAEADEVERLIQSKQLLIDNINEMDTEFEVYYSRLKSVLNIQSIEEVKETQIPGADDLKRIVTAIVDTIKNIQGLEVENKNKAQQIVDQLGNDIRRISQAKAVNNGYSAFTKQPPPSYFFDTKK